jgi:hypothetical protein
MGGVSFAAQLKDFEKFIVDRLDQTAGDTMREIGRRLIYRSPVDTGLFRSNWFYSFNAPDGSTTTSVSETQVNNISEIPEKGASTGVHFLQNNLPYAWRLEMGSSKQAPLGIVGLTALEFGGIVDDVVARISK